MFSKKVVIPAKAGIQSFQRSLDAPVSKYGAGSSGPAWRTIRIYGQTL